MTSPANPLEDADIELGISRGPWEKRLAYLVDTMRELSRQTDPQQMVRLYGRRMVRLMPTDRFISLSRRDLARPHVRVTRSSTWPVALNPWRDRDRLPMFSAGMLSELIYGEEPVVIDELNVGPDDPGAAYFTGMRSLMAIPMYDQGLALNMIVMMRERPAAFDREQLPEHAWMANLFGRATHNLVLRDEVEAAYRIADRELQVVSDIQRSLLPAQLPNIPGLELAAHYQTSTRAGGDYYDFFPLPDGRWGILMADVSGHGTPAAVMMAVTHSIAHMNDGPPDPPSRLLGFINRHLAARYAGGGNFVTAFYGIYDPATRVLTYASGGHPPMRVRGQDGPRPLRGEPRLPLGIEADEVYLDCSEALRSGDVLLLFTDGITEARNARHDLFGIPRLDDALRQSDGKPSEVIRAVLGAVDEFSGYRPADDDRTLLAARVG